MRLRTVAVLSLLGVTVRVASIAPGCASSRDGKLVALAAAPRARATFDALQSERAAAESMTAESFERRYAPAFRDDLPYAPLDAKGLATIEAKTPLAPDEKERLARDGFVVLPRRKAPTFALGYADAFRDHLPVYISADAILYAVHKSYAALLRWTEEAVLTRDLDTLVSSMRRALKERGIAGANDDVKNDVDDHLAVAASLLAGAPVAPVASGHAAAVSQLVAYAMAADGAKDVSLFGQPRSVDFSQFEPRGHYKGTPELERYFRAMMWLSRTDLRAIETQPNGSQIFRRRQLEGALAMRQLMGDDARAAWTRIDGALGAIVGEPDEMTVADLDPLLKELAVSDLEGLAGQRDDAIAATLARTGLGQQRIASQLADRLPDVKGTLPLHVSFALVNQRYTLDAHVLSNVSFDRVRSGTVMRMMPDPLDVAFAALDNDGAAELLRPELDRYSYAPDLHMMRVLATSHGDDYWQRNLYTTWSAALRGLSPTPAALAPPEAGGLPSVAATRAWNARILGTQLASWAELRHDTVLYAKPSYSTRQLCEFPDAYVDPYPEAFHAIVAHARLGEELAAGPLASDARLSGAAKSYFGRLKEVATNLEQMARQERAREPFTQAQMDFVNGMVTSQRGGLCGGPPHIEGWYAGLFVDPSDVTQFAPSVADVHTQPSDEAGDLVGRVLHVGTGYANGFVATVDSGSGPRAYAGYVSSYGEKTTSHFERLDDQAWSASLQRGERLEAPRWLRGIVP